jgi:3-deoxy-D-manno-octulosonate 8-phosphate phosphatase (KDO 8-P phosphatase)
MTKKNYKEILRHITTLVFDVDGVLTDGTVFLMKDEMVRTMIARDGYALQLAVKKGYNVAIITGGNSPTVKFRLESLGIKDVFMGAGDKTIVFDQYLADKGIQPEEVMYMGDDIPDYKVMEKAGLAVCPQDAATEVKSISDYISDKNGGRGCARDIIEQVMRVQGKWFDQDAHHW